MAKITRSIDQVIFKHAPGSFVALEESGMYGRISRIKGKQDVAVDEKMMLKKVKQYVKKWEDESEGKVLGFNSEDINESTIVAIRPEEAILWDFLPNSLFECINLNCKVLNNSSDKFFKGRCKVCSSRLKQFRYVRYHACGHIQSFQPLPDTNCPTHGKDFFYLFDTGKFQSSTWRCRKCQYETSLRMPICPIGLCRKVAKEQGDKDIFLRGAIWSDPWIYFSQTATFVNLKDDQIKSVLNSDRKDELLISAYLGAIEAGQGNLRKASENILNVTCTNCGAKVPITMKYCGECGTMRTEIPKEIKFEIKKNLTLDPLADDSDLAIFSAVRDLESTLSFKAEKNRQKEANDIERSTISEITLNSLNEVGIDDIYLIGDFPLTHIAYGYTRFLSKPPAWLRSYPSLSQTDTKVPVYTNCVKTEAWMIQLSAKYTLEWLVTNKLFKLSGDKNLKEITEIDAKLLLLELLNKETEDENEIHTQIIVDQLIHSLSHTVLYSLAVESGLDIASFGEILLPKVLSFVVYGGESDIGGLSASFNQGISSLLDLILNDLRSCKFDPSCSQDDDGACVGCLHLPRGCAEFNEKLSRAYVFGGTTKNLEAKEISIGYLDLKNK